MKRYILVTLLLTSFSALSASEAGQALLDEKCTACHMTSSSSAKLTNGKMGGPPMWGIMKKVKARFKDQKDGEAFIGAYALSPSKEKMLFPQATIDYFGVMPSMQGKATQEELSEIAKYLYKLYQK